MSETQPANQAYPDDEISLIELWDILVRRKLIPAVTVLVDELKTNRQRFFGAKWFYSKTAPTVSTGNACRCGSSAETPAP